MQTHEKHSDAEGSSAPETVPVCILSAARRPDLTIAVSEKRRQDEGYMTETDETEVP